MPETQPFDPSHADRVTVLHTNFNGTKILTASIDHRIKVWSRDPKTGHRELLDTFTAHDADIRDAKFLSPTLGPTHLCSIGNDLKFHLWAEDVAQPPRQGHRFRRIATIQSTPRVPFVSLDVKTLTTDHISTFLALIDRQGLLSVYEPSNPDDLREWTLLDCFNVCAPNAAPGRGEESGFKVSFDPNPTPLAYMNSVNEEREQLGLVVCALNEVKIYRSVVPSNTGGDGGTVGGIGLGIGGGTGVSSNGSASGRLTFYEAIRLPVHAALVRDIAWAPFSVRGTDRIATACKDGAVRIFELGVAKGPGGNGHGAAQQSSSQPRNTMQQRQHQSSLTTAITGRQPSSSSIQTSNHPGGSRANYTFPYLTTISSATNLQQAHTDAWSLSFDSQGQVLMSTGSDGVTKLWRKSVLGGQWMVFAGQDITEDGDETEDEEDDDEKQGAESA